MHERVRIIIAFCFYYSGLVRLAHWWRQRKPGRQLIILKYHRASHPYLRDQMRYLSRHYRVLHLEDALEELYAAPTSRPQKRPIPVVMTFDVGYRDNYN